MSFTLDSLTCKINLDPAVRRYDMESSCLYCGRPVGRQSPMAVFKLQEPGIVGVAHPQCSYFDFRFAQFSLDGLMPLQAEDISLLAHFYYRLFQLPGQGHHRSILRRSLAALLIGFPEGFLHIPEVISLFKEDNPSEVLRYPGDLETDFYIFLGQVRRDSQRQPFKICIDMI
jgi:hypothetical protein